MKKLIKSGINSIAKALRNGSISSLELTEHCLWQIDTLDSQLGAFLFVDRENAIKAAIKADMMLENAQRSNNFDILSPLCGIPCAVKDNISVLGMPCTCASKLLEGFMPAYDATVVKKLRKCGAVILGKTNMDEFAMGSATENSAYKITKNPYNTVCTPGGSSGGSAVAVAAGMCVFALGSDTGGSVRLPASYCNLVGFKPTWGALSRNGLVGFAPAFDAIGILANNADDLDIVFSAACGADTLDDTSTEQIGPSIKKIGIIEELTNDNCPLFIRTALFELCEKLKAVGIEIVSVSIPEVKYIPAIYSVLGCAQAFSNLCRFDGIRYGARAFEGNLSDTYIQSRSRGFSGEVKSRILFGAYVLQGDGRQKYFEKAENAKSILIKSTNEALNCICDAFILPTAFQTAPKLGVPCSDFTDMCTAFANISGLPAVSVPYGFENNMPFGLQLIGNKFSDRQIIGLCREVTENE